MSYTGPIVSVADGGTGANTASGARTNLGITNVATQTVTQYDVLVGGAANAITSVGPGSAGQVMQSGGNAANPAYSTATYPSTATGTGTLLRADGTNWVATTATYPATTTINQLLYSSAANVIAGVTTANNGVLVTGSSGIPSIDTTNFSVLSTGLQLKGNNTNTASPAGYIGEVKSSSAVSVNFPNNTNTNVTSISLTAGNWVVSGSVTIDGTLTGTRMSGSIVTTSATSGTVPYSRIDSPTMPTANSAANVCIPPNAVSLSSTTTYYLTGFCQFTVGTCTASGYIIAVRVG